MEILSDGPGNVEEEKTTAAFKLDPASGKEAQSLQGIRTIRGLLWRRAEYEDIEEIEDLMAAEAEKMDSLYQAPRIDHLIQKSHFPIVQLDDNGKVVSFVAFQSFPNIPSVPPFTWIEWINEKYRFSDANSRNCLFIHYMAWNPKIANEFLYFVLKTTFLEFVHLKYVIFVRPPFVKIPEIYGDYFIPILPCDMESSVKNFQSVHVCPRVTIVAPLRIRAALAEDSDVLMSLLRENENSTFEKLYGEFFFAELVEFSGSSDRKILVCEVDGIAAGVMVLNLSVDLDSLAEFELMPFNGLQRPYERDSYSYDSSMGSMPSGSRTPDIIDSLRFQDFEITDIYASQLDTSIVHLKENESNSSSEETYDIDFTQFSSPPSSLKLLEDDRDSSKDLEKLTRHSMFAKVESSDSFGTGEIHARRHEKLLRLVSTVPLPKYEGEPNAFAIEFIAFDHSKFDERQSIDFLRASFSVASDMDYCILEIPSHVTPLPLLNHFVKASHRAGKQPRSELYVCHSSIFSRLPVTVKATDISDLEEIRRFLQRTYNSGAIFSEFRNSFRSDSTEKSFALLAGSHIVGIALIRFEYDFHILLRHFDFAEFSMPELDETENTSIVKHFMVIPTFHNFVKFFLSDVMRLADVTCLFHVHHHDSKLNGSILSVLGELVPLKPKKMSRSSDFASSITFAHDNSLAVFFTNSQMCCRMGVSTNKIIVVIGASATAFSFFENIIFGSSRSHVCYSNLIWISAHGTGQELPPNKIRDLVFPVQDKYDRDYRTMLSLKAHVHFIYGVMTGINRNEKYVVINERAVVRYDILILTVGLQFARPIPEISREKQSCCHNRFYRSSLSRFLPTHVSTHVHGGKPNPVNMFEMNTFLEADTVLKSFERLKTRLTQAIPAEKIILYGHSITIFVMMQALLKMGIPGGMIAFVEPFPTNESSITAFGDIAVYSEIINCIQRCGILYYPEYFLYDWTFSTSGRLSTITFHSSGGQVTFPCLVFLPMVKKIVSENNFQACNNAGLIYDGKLIIDSQFKTNDECIYAAGPFTKYSRRYCAPERAHQYFSSVEVGEKLADFIRREVEPLKDYCDEFSSEGDTLPTLEKPVMIYCQVPGDLYFFSLRKPGSLIEAEASFESGNTGEILITGDCTMNKGIGYFRVHLDQFGCVEDITCFSKTEFDYVNLYSLYGLHEKLLNNLLVRYDCGMIPDFFEYFQQPWTEAIFHGEFHRLSEGNMAELAEFLAGEASVKTRTFLGKGEHDYKRPVSSSSRMKLKLDYDLSSLKSAIEKNVLEFINYFDGELTKYATPSTKLPCHDKVPIAYWRLADSFDVDAIYDLIEKSDHVSEEIFNDRDIADLIEKSAFPFVQFNSNDELISFTAIFCNPNIPAVPSFEWFEWLGRMYEFESLTPRNSCFIHYMVWRPDYYDDFLGLTLENIFMQYPFLKYTIIIRPPLVKIPDLMAEYFIPVLPKDLRIFSCDPNSVQTLMFCLRHSLLDRLKIRLAVVEDHDDLMPIIERQTSKLRELYGDFCMAEVIEYPGTEDRKTLVCEVNGYALGFMNLNRMVDLEQLNSQFDLGVFHGLRKPSPDDTREEFLQENEEKVVYLPEEVSSSLDLINSETMEYILKWRPTRCKSRDEDEGESRSEESVDDNDLPRSVVELIRDSVEANIIPKFSAYALASSKTDTRNALSSEDGLNGEGKNSIRNELSLISLTNFNLPVYHGPGNAFCIELFAVHENFDDHLCSDFIEAAFELFPDLEYCMLTLPSQCNTFPLLDLFVRVTPRPMKIFKQELYVCHKSAIMLSFMRVRRLVKSDLRDVYNLLRGIKNREFIYADIANSCIFPDSAYQSFVLISDTAIVGAAVICNENGLEYLTQHYHVGHLIEFELHKIDDHAVLKHFILSPIFQTHARYFLRDIMRMADITSLYRARYEERKSQFNTSSLITALGQLVPVKPRRMIKYHLPSLGPNTPPPHLLNYDAPFALYHINSRICSFPKYTTNINIVIVGTSRTAFAFLERLLYAPNSAYVTYNNITWVSPHGTGADLAPHPARDLMFPYRGKYNRRYKAQISLGSFVNTVYGVMTQINRTEKYIWINNMAIVRYDYLILFCGKQYLMPVPLVREVDMTKCHRTTRPRCSLFKYLVNQKPDGNEEETTDYPSNVLLINSATDATNAIITVQYLMKKRRKDVETKEKIIVYGGDLNVYLCIQSLLKFGVPPELLVLVETPSKNGSSEDVFVDPNVDAEISNIIQELNIRHYKGYLLYDWSICDNNQVESIIFHSKHQKVRLRCMAMFPFEEKLVSDVTFKAVNEASLVYDGKLVINHRFQTNDPYIYSAGTFTKYQRKYFADDKNHEYYDCTEAGQLLAEIIRLEVDPTEQGDRKESTEEELPELKKPILISGQLPGDWNYFHLRKPGKLEPLEVQCNVKEYGDTLITGDCKMTNGYGYFRLHLDDFGFVRTITCFTKDEIDAENLQMIYGKHEKYLNDLLLRFNLGLIADFFGYFREPWVYALYHDRFPLLMEANSKLFNREESFVDKRVNEMIDKLLKENKFNEINENELNDIVETFEVSNIKEEMTANVVRYLEIFDEAFPMYATSGVLRRLPHGAKTSLHYEPTREKTPASSYQPDITEALANVTTVDLTVCKVTHLGSEYVGRKTNTESNATCQYWSSTTEKGAEDLTDLSFPDGSKSLAKNYCRNPNMANSGPWCFTTDKKLSKETCGIPLCRVTGCRLTGPGMEYAGGISKSVSGRKCNKWRKSHELREKHKEPTFKNHLFPDGSVADAENRCRNPRGNATGPWCYVDKENSKLEEIELCDIPFCDDVDPWIYSEGSSKGRYFLFSSFNDTNSIRFSVRLWDESDWLRAKIFILLSGIDTFGNRSEIAGWGSSVEIMLSNTGSGIMSSEEAEVKDTPKILSALRWKTVDVTWAIVDNSMVVQVFEDGKIKPFLTGEIELTGKPLRETSFRFFSLAGYRSLWNISSEEDCHIHTAPLMEFTRYYLMRKTTLGFDVELSVRAVTQAVLLFRAAPMTDIHQIQVVIDDGNKIKVAYYNENKAFVVVRETSWPKILNFWKWQTFKITIMKDRLQIYHDKTTGNELVMDATHPTLAGVMWISFGSPFVSYWTIYCDPRGIVDPPPALPPECISSGNDDYNGTQTVTAAGHQCISWLDDRIPDRYQKASLFEHYGGKASCQNYCRNLDKDPKGPFCMVREKNTDKILKENCFPRPCHLGECLLAGTANDYTGHLNETRSKRQCRAWTEFKDEYMVDVNNFPDPTLEDAGNYCRNPTKNIGGPWCYTADPNVQQDFCYVRDCDKPLECTIISSGFRLGHLLYIMPSWRKHGVHFWLKTWNPDIYEGLKIRLLSIEGEKSYDLLIGDDDNEKLKFFFVDQEGEETLLIHKTLLHLVPAGKWGGFWLRPDEGKIELGYHGVSDPFFEWTSTDESLTFDPAFIDFGTIQNHWIGVNFFCTECLLERTTSAFPSRMYPINLWRTDEISPNSVPNNLVLNLRGMASVAILLMSNPDFDAYVAVKLASDGEKVSIWEYEWNYRNKKLAEYDSVSSFSASHWTSYELNFTEQTISLKQDNASIFTWESRQSLLFYWFSMKVYQGYVVWTANCRPGDIDGPPRNGHWGAWEPWECSASCGGGQGRTQRLCNNPPPNVFGRDCKGSAVYDGPCNTFPCGEISPETNDIIRWHLSSQNTALEVEAGQKVVLPCNKEATKLILREVKKMNITWTVNGFRYSRRKARINHEYSLVIPKTNEHDSGVYLCMAQQDQTRVPSKVVLEVISLIVNRTTPTKKIRKGRSLTLKCNGLALSYVYGDLSQRWEINGTVWKDYGITTLETADTDKIVNIDDPHDGIWTCVIVQPDLGFKWTTNWMHIKVKSAPNFWTHLTEDAATAPLFAKLETEAHVKIVFFAILIVTLLITVVPTLLLIKYLGRNTE